jgi:hypothetical protein
VRQEIDEKGNKTVEREPVKTEKFFSLAFEAEKTSITVIGASVPDGIGYAGSNENIK